MRKERRTSRPWRLLMAALMVFAACGGPGGEAGVDGRASAARFLDELREGRHEPAWQGTSAEFKSLMGLENLRDYVRTHPALKAPAEYVETRTIDRNGRAASECVFRATVQVRGKAVPATIKVLVAPGDEGWQVEYLTVE